MSDKVKSELLLDYVAEILPPKYDDDGVDIGLKTDFHYHNNSSCYFFFMIQITNLSICKTIRIK